jgi:DNA-binding MarR family transcriptional regulator
MPRASTKMAPSKAIAAASKAVPDDDPSPRGLWFCTWKIWLETRRRLDTALEPLGLRSREFWMLVIAGRGNVSQNEMADLCGLDPSSLVPVLDGMERRGLLHRQRNPNDRRVQWVRRTAEGDRLFARALPRAQHAEALQLEALSAPDQRQLVAAMRKLILISK